MWDGSVLTVTKFDRFARNMAEANEILTDLCGRGVLFGLGANVREPGSYRGGGKVGRVEGFGRGAFMPRAIG